MGIIPSLWRGRTLESCYWSYQFVGTNETRKYLYERSQEEWSHEDLTQDEISWIMEVEDNETAVLKWAYPASGGEGRWYIRCGHYVTLSEVFNLGKHFVSCYDLYLTYKSCKIWIHKRAHSVSNTPEAQITRNARILHHQEHGFWGLRRR